MKDEQEVREAVRVWEETVGGLKAAVVGSGMAVPELEVDMDVTGGKIVKKAEEWCWLCCLGRAEVVGKLKEVGYGKDGLEGKGVHDGQWSAGWGHRSCRNFWEHDGGKM